MSLPAPMLKLARVTKRYRAAGGGDEVSVLSDLTFELARGETTAIIGPSGSGKSTLLNIIGTLDRPDSGEVLVDGQDVTKLDELQLAAFRNRQIGFIFQSHHLLPHCTVLENVLVPTLAKVGQASRLSSDESPEQRAARLLKRVGLDHRLHHRPGQLSGGERQRVAVVRALINGAKLLLADEPTGALDRASAQNLAQLLLELNREEGVTLVVVTHAGDLAQKMGRVLELQDGKLVSGGQ